MAIDDESRSDVDVFQLSLGENEDPRKSLVRTGTWPERFAFNIKFHETVRWSTLLRRPGRARGPLVVNGCLRFVTYPASYNLCEIREACCCGFMSHGVYKSCNCVGRRSDLQDGFGYPRPLKKNINPRAMCASGGWDLYISDSAVGVTESVRHTALPGCRREYYIALLMSLWLWQSRIVSSFFSLKCTRVFVRDNLF